MIENAVAPLLEKLQGLEVRLDEIEAKIDSSMGIASETGETMPTYAQVSARSAPVTARRDSVSISLQNRFQCLEALKEKEELQEKKQFAVVVGLPEAASEDSNEDSAEDSAKNDELVVKSVLQKEGIDQDSFIRAFRHGKIREKKTRILKVELDSCETRDKLIKAFRGKSRPEELRTWGHCRRDMTASERFRDRQLRTECHQLNLKEGKRKWIVRDLKRIQAKSPWPDYKVKVKDEQEMEAVAAQGVRERKWEL